MMDNLVPETRLFGVMRSVPIKLRRGRYVLEQLLVRAPSAAEAGRIADEHIIDLKLEYWGEKHGLDVTTYPA